MARQYVERGQSVERGPAARVSFSREGQALARAGAERNGPPDDGGGAPAELRGAVSAGDDRAGSLVDQRIGAGLHAANLQVLETADEMQRGLLERL